MNFVIESKRSKEWLYINIFIFVAKYIFIYSLIERERERIFVKERGREGEKEQWPNNTGLSLSSAIFPISIQFNFYHTFELGRFAEVNKYILLTNWQMKRLNEWKNITFQVIEIVNNFGFLSQFDKFSYTSSAKSEQSCCTH